MDRIHKEKNMLMLAQFKGYPSTSIHKKTSETLYFQSRSMSLYSYKSNRLFIKDTLYFKKRAYASKKLSLVFSRRLFVVRASCAVRL